VEEKVKPAIQLSFNELCAFSAILQYYERYTWNATAPSAKRSQRFLEVYALIVKLALLPSEKATTLTVSEFGYLKTALDLFISQVVNIISASESRTGILVSCTQLQAYIDSVIIPKQS